MRMKIWLGMLTLYIVWGSTYLAIRFAVETMPPFLMAATRFFIAGAILYIWRRWINKETPPTRRQWRSAFIIGIFLLVGGNGGVVWAETMVPSSIAALVIATTPLWMVLLDALRPRQRVIPSMETVAGVIMGLTGILVLVGPHQILSGTGEFAPAGLMALLLAAIFWSVGSLYHRNADLPASPLLGTGMEMLAGAFGLLFLSLLFGEWRQVQLASISTQSILALIYLIFFGALVGFSTYVWLLRVASTPLVATYAYVNPLIAVLLGYFLADETLNVRILIAGGIIISSVVLINFSRPRQRYSTDIPANSQPDPSSD
jgi:drug/metabolite transporter (DMT)-like permease